MQESRGVHELDGRCRADVAVSGVSAQLRACESEHRSKSLAAAIDQVVREFRDHLDIGNRFVEDYAINGLEVISDKFEKRM
jgi:hypothetical protein